MKKVVLVAGATGNLGGRIVNALIARGADVKALVRLSADPETVKEFESKGVTVVKVDMSDQEALQNTLAGVSCVVSALQGLKDVIIDAQVMLLNAAVASGVTRFIPSDFSSDFTDLPEGDNRNFDLRRQFHRHLEKAAIAATSVFNGAFSDILTYNTPLLDLKNNMIGYWENADWPIDFTTMDNTAAFTAAAAIDDSTPAKLNIASFRITPNELKALADKTLGRQFSIKYMSSRSNLTAYARNMRKEQPGGEKELYPQWQQMQYLLSMFSAEAVDLDNDRYAGIDWTSAADFLAALS